MRSSATATPAGVSISNLCSRALLRTGLDFIRGLIAGDEPHSEGSSEPEDTTSIAVRPGHPATPCFAAAHELAVLTAGSLCLAAIAASLSQRDGMLLASALRLRGYPMKRSLLAGTLAAHNRSFTVNLPRGHAAWVFHAIE